MDQIGEGARIKGDHCRSRNGSSTAWNVRSTLFPACMDAVFSIMQMPPGVPVATVAIDGAKNAAILAAKMLATGDDELLARLEAYTENLKEQVEAKDQKLQQIGYENYLNQ